MIFSWIVMRSKESSIFDSPQFGHLGFDACRGGWFDLDIWNQVEKKFEEVTPNEKRLDLCRDYGIIYYYRTGEKRKE